MTKEITNVQASFGSAAHFAIEPIQIMWKQKRLLGMLLLFPLLFPLIVDLVLGYVSPYLEIRSTISDMLLFIAQPFWAIAWIRGLFYPNEKPTVKSYFTFDRFYWYFLGCALLIQLLNIPMEHITESGTFHESVALVLLIVWTILKLPIHLIFPAIAVRNPFPLWQAWSLVKPFYLRYILSIALMSLIFSLAGLTIMYIGGFLLTALYVTAPGILQSLYQLWPQTVISQGILLLIMTYLLTLPSLYYKEYLLKK